VTTVRMPADRHGDAQLRQVLTCHHQAGTHEGDGADQPWALPLSPLPRPTRPAKAYYVICATDRRNRLADQLPLWALRRSAAHKLVITAAGEAIVARRVRTAVKSSRVKGVSGCLPHCAIDTASENEKA
jgi:hypothetical protein